MLRPLRTSYATVSKSKIAPLGLDCARKLTDNPYFPKANPYAEAIREALGNYTPAAAIKNPIPEQTAQLFIYRKDLNAAITAAAKYANEQQPGNEPALLSTGLELAKEREKHTSLDPPRTYSLADGTEADTVCAKFVRAAFAVATEVRYTDDPTLPWYLWRAVTSTRSSVLLRGYKKKTEVFAMFRSVGGDTDDQEFSDVVSRVVQ